MLYTPTVEDENAKVISEVCIILLSCFVRTSYRVSLRISNAMWHMYIRRYSAICCVGGGVHKLYVNVL